MLTVTKSEVVLTSDLHSLHLYYLIFLQRILIFCSDKTIKIFLLWGESHLSKCPLL